MTYTTLLGGARPAGAPGARPDAPAHIILYYAILYLIYYDQNPILYYTILLFYTILYYTILYYTNCTKCTISIIRPDAPAHITNIAASS